MKFLKKKKTWLFIILLIFLIGAGYYFMRPESVRYQTVKVQKRDIEQSVIATGQLDAVRKVDVGAQVSGQLQKLYVEVGDKVKKNQLLALIDPEQAINSIKEVEANIEDLKAQLTQAKAELELSQISFKRQTALQKVQAVSKQDFDQAKTTVKVNEGKIGVLNAQIKRNEALLNTAQNNLNYTKIIAPMSGEVVKITTLEGQTVIAAQQAPTILTLADLHTMLVNTEVSEADIVNLKPGMHAWFTILGAPEKHFTGILKDILPTPEKNNNAVFYYARFEVPNPNGILRLSMTAQVHIILQKVEQVLTIPITALGQMLDSTHYTVTILKNGIPETKTVKIGIRDNINIQVISGLNENDEVIVGTMLGEQHGSTA